jgi:hypothetical protein
VEFLRISTIARFSAFAEIYGGILPIANERAVLINLGADKENPDKSVKSVIAL